MNLNFFDTTGVEHLIENYFELSFSGATVPFQSTILPVALTNITYIFSGDQHALVDGLKMPLENLIVSGQFFRSYKLLVNSEGYSFGMSLQPTALYKIFGTDISKLSNKHISLNEVNQDFYDKLNPLFKNYENPKEIIKKINGVLLDSRLFEDKNTDYIDQAIDKIRQTEGMIHIEELLNDLPFSRKSLETHFKKIVGLTPGKYIRLYRFLNLMRKYESQQIKLKDLIYMYDYYDQSHFTKDFKLFMLESPHSYFKKDYPIIKKYLVK